MYFQSWIPSSTHLRLETDPPTCFSFSADRLASTTAQTDLISAKPAVQVVNYQYESIDTCQTKHKYPAVESFASLASVAEQTSTYFQFEILHESKKSKARVGRITTPHGSFLTPEFVPVATNATLKHVDPQLAERSGTQLTFCNTYHLLVHPGREVVRAAGGLHRWMHYDRPLITDSGGFQIFSMANNQPQDELKGKNRRRDFGNCAGGLVKVTEESVKFRSYRNGDLIELSPESAVEAQKDFGADLIIPLDILLPHATSPRKLIESFHRTHRWEARSLRMHLANLNRQAMYSVIHGGTNDVLRRMSAEYLTKLPFQGVAIGGSLGKTLEEMYSLLASLTPLLPRQLPRHLLGIGDERSMGRIAQYGIDTFDSAYPTRVGRHGRFFVGLNEQINIMKAEFAHSHDRPILMGCQCYTCTNYSLSYVHHLYKMNEVAGSTLGTIHNLAFMAHWTNSLRQAILADEV